MDYNLVRKIVALVERSDIHELEVESEGIRIKVNKDAPGISPSVVATRAIPETHLTATPTLPSTRKGQLPQSSEEVQQDGKEMEYITIDSPMVGTFYRAPSPDSAPFVKVGDSVAPEQVVCVLEAMKVMNELQAEVSGEIKEILVENAQPVEFGQPLFKVAPLS